MSREFEKIVEQIAGQKAEQKRIEGRMEFVLTVMERQSCSMEDAMEFLEVPADERTVIREKLGKESIKHF